MGEAEGGGGKREEGEKGDKSRTCKRERLGECELFTERSYMNRNKHICGAVKNEGKTDCEGRQTLRHTDVWRVGSRGVTVEHATGGDERMED